ncbi:MAG: BON domain-containing protein [Nitrococcus sp.]|nr:BON domain-containing protein [Nitrococcus sp.]
MSEVSIESRIQAALERDRAIDLRRYPIQVHHGDAVRLEGTVADIEVKRRAIQIAHRIAGNAGIDDRLRLDVARPRPNDELRQAVAGSLMQEPAFVELQLLEELPAHPAEDWFHVSAHAGVVMLEGVVGSLSHRRLAEVLAWWTPGTADVDNRLHVQPPERDSDDEIADVIRIVLEKEPAFDIAQIQIEVDDRVVSLRGLVHSEEERRIAAWDCWCIPGVHDVLNQLEVAK